MPSIHTKKHMFVYRQTKKGLVKCEVKFDSSNYKLRDKAERDLERGIHLGKNYPK